MRADLVAAVRSLRASTTFTAVALVVLGPAGGASGVEQGLARRLRPLRDHIVGARTNVSALDHGRWVPVGLEATDPRACVAALAALAVAALVASAIPARRAATVDPVEALRAE